MKKLRILLTLVLIISGTVANAYSFMADGIYYNIDGNTVSVTYLSDHSSNYSGAVSIPSTVTYNGVTYRVTSIGDRAFANCKNLTSIDIPSSVTSIGDAAFTECDGLTFISLPNKLTSRVFRTMFLKTEFKNT